MAANVSHIGAKGRKPTLVLLLVRSIEKVLTILKVPMALLESFNYSKSAIALFKLQFAFRTETGMRRIQC